MSSANGIKMFVAGLTSEVNENDLRTLFQECGEVTEVKIVRKKTGESKGYGFVVFPTDDIAKVVQKTYQGKEFKGKKLDIKSSKVDGCLYIRGIRKEWNVETTEQKMKCLFAGVTKVVYIEDKAMPNHNRGYCFVFFESKKVATKTLGDILLGKYTLEGSTLTGNWADSPNEENDDKKSICVRNLPKAVSEEELRDIFAKYGEIESIRLGRNLKTNPREDISFINYASEGPAEVAVTECQGLDLHGNKIEVVINKKNDNKNKMQRKMNMQSQMANPLFPYYQMPGAAVGVRYPMMSNQGVEGMAPASNNSNQYYKTRLCNNFQKNGSCQRGANCVYAHGEKELRQPVQSSSYPAVNTGVSATQYQQVKPHQGGPTYPQITTPMVNPYQTTGYDYSLYNANYANMNNYARTQQGTYPTMPTDTYGYQNYHQ